MTAIAFAQSEELDDILAGIDAYLASEVYPRYEKNRELMEEPRLYYAEDGRYSPDVVQMIREIRMTSATAGYFNISVPEEMGGGGMGFGTYFACLEHIFRRCGGNMNFGQYAISHWAYGPSAVLAGLTDEAKERVLKPLLTGEQMMCFGMSEPDAGSDVARIRTTADAAQGGGWLLNGRKIWTSNAPIAEWMIVLAVTDRELSAQRKGGISAFMVPMSASGVRIERVIRMWGEGGGTEAETAFEDVAIEPWQLVGSLNQGFRIGMQGVSLGRVFNCARAIGLGRWALEMAVEYTKSRVVFDRPISEYQGVMFPLAESFTELHAAHLLALNAAALLDAGQGAVKELSMAKMMAVQAGARAVDRAIQAHGAIGFTNELGLTEAYRHLRQVNVADGTNEILTRTIVNRLLKGDVAI